MVAAARAALAAAAVAAAALVPLVDPRGEPGDAPRPYQ